VEGELLRDNDSDDLQFSDQEHTICAHYEMEWKFSGMRGIDIQKCKACGYEKWHYEDAHG